MERLTARQLLDREDSQGKDYVLLDKPTGLYADRQSYGNRPILAFILGDELPCKAAARPISTQSKVEERIDEATGYRVGEAEVKSLEFVADNENLGVAAAFVDKAIRESAPIEVHGRYVGGLLEVDFLKVGRFGFTFSDYQFPCVGEE